MALLDTPTLSKVKKLCKSSCANYSNGSCILIDTSCDYFTKYGKDISCDWFEEAVLPNDMALEESYKEQHGISYIEDEAGNQVTGTHFSYKPCKRCGKPFKPTSRGNRYCSDSCKESARKQSYRIANANRK